MIYKQKMDKILDYLLIFAWFIAICEITIIIWSLFWIDFLWLWAIFAVVGIIIIIIPFKFRDLVNIMWLRQQGKGISDVKYQFIYRKLHWTFKPDVTVDDIIRERPAPAVLTVLLMLAQLIFAVVYFSGTFHSTEQKIEYKVKEISKLHVGLKNKNAEIISLKQKFQNEIKGFENRTLIEKRRSNIRSYQQATQNQTIVCNLSLLRTKTAYVQKLDEIQEGIRVGIKELEFLEGKTRADLEMVRVLGGKEARQIMKSLDRVIEKYLPEAEELIVEIDESALPSLEQVWNQIIKNRR